MKRTSLAEKLCTLGLSTSAREYEAWLGRAEAENWGYQRLLEHIAETEANAKTARKTDRLLGLSNLPSDKTLDLLDQAELPDRIRRQLPTLLDGEFVRRADNLLCFGLPGRGKTHVAAAVSRALVERHQMKVLFIETYKLVAQLVAAKQLNRLPAAIAKLDTFNAIVLDDIGYIQQSRDETEVLFTLFAACYEKKSLIITSNLVFSEWEQIFKDKMMTMAAVDRIVHHCIILDFNGDSHRAKIAMARAKT